MICCRCWPRRSEVHAQPETLSPLDKVYEQKQLEKKAQVAAARILGTAVQPPTVPRMLPPTIPLVLMAPRTFGSHLSVPRNGAQRIAPQPNILQPVAGGMVTPPVPLVGFIVQFINFQNANEVPLSVSCQLSYSSPNGPLSSRF